MSKVEGCGLDLSDSEQGPIASRFECINEPLILEGAVSFSTS